MSSPAQMPTTPASPSTPTGNGLANDRLGTSSSPGTARDPGPGQPTRAHYSRSSTLRLGLARGRLELKMFSRSKTHLLRAFAKLGVDDRTAAVTVAMRQGLLPHP